MKYEAEIKVTLRIDADAAHPVKIIKQAAQQAVNNALQSACDNGFEHCLDEADDDCSMSILGVDVTSVGEA